MADLVHPELREVEREVDCEYLANPLLKLDFADAAWRVLAFFEDLAVAEILRGPPGSQAESAAFFDYVINKMQYPLAWLFRSCKPGGALSFKYDEDLYLASAQLERLSEAYEAFVSAFTFASRGRINLRLDGHSVRLLTPFFNDPRYEAYDRLTLPEPARPDFSRGNIIKLVERYLKIHGESFTYPLSRRIIEPSMRMLQPIVQAQFQLPSDWIFPRYSLADFRSAAALLVTLAHIHLIAHLQAAQRGCPGMGYESSVLLVPRRRLVWMLIRHANLHPRTAEALVNDLTYGARGIRQPDPALQPLIPLNPDLLAIPPTLLVASSTERNFITLLNRLPSERAAYLRLVDHKETAMRQKIEAEASGLGFRYFSGPIPGRPDLPDIDAAIISDVDRVVLCIELKWFTAPAEPREVFEKVQEIRRGLDQAAALSDALAVDPAAFNRALSTSPEYSYTFLVASANSIGDDTSQHPTIPVMNLDHMLRKLSAAASLPLVNDWLLAREYLPVEGTDFRVVEPTYTVGQWTIHWIALEILNLHNHPDWI